MDTQLLSSALLEEPKDKKPVVDNNVRRAWNEFTSYLEKKGLKGNPILDRGEKSFEVLEMYRKENPNTPLTRAHIVPIQEDFGRYRQGIIDKIEKSKASYGTGTTKENFMKGLSKVDGIPGSMTTSFQFPSAYLETFEQAKPVKKESKGFSTLETDVYAKGI